MMIVPRLENCVECASISTLLSNIDCKLTSLAKKQYGNILYSLNTPISGELASDLLNYKRILTYKYCNPDYASCYSVEQIASKVKLLIHK